MISIIVPIYNAENYLKDCLDSLLGQTYYDIEVICINDGSQDKSGSILSLYSGKDHRLKVITQQNRGIAAARNQGIQSAKGRWIMFVDADDWIDADTCEKAVNLASNYNADVVFWAYMREFRNGKKSPRYLLNEDKFFGEKDIQTLHRQIVGPLGAELRDPSLLHSWGTVWGKLYSRKIISDTKFTDTKIVGSAEDVLFNIEVFTRVRNAFYMNQTMYHYRKSETSFTGGFNENLDERWKNLYKMMSDISVKNNLPSDFSKALNNRIALGLIGQGLNQCVSPQNTGGKIRAIKHIITQDQYRLAIQDMPLQYFSPHWRLFFWAAKRGHARIVYTLLKMIKILI